MKYLVLNEGSKSGPKIEGPLSEEGSSQILEGLHRDRGHIMRPFFLVFITQGPS